MGCINNFVPKGVQFYQMRNLVNELDSCPWASGVTSTQGTEGLRSVLGTTDVNYVRDTHALALVGSSLA
jgi:hypothetical protein